MEDGLSVVTVSWNAAAELGDWFNSLNSAAEIAAVPLEVVVVDNDSRDDSRAIARAFGAKVVENPVNAGFAVAASQGLAVASRKWVFLANPDLLVERHFFLELRAAMDQADESVAAYVPSVIYASDQATIQHVGLGVDTLGFARELRPSEAGGTTRVFGGSGGAMLINRCALAEVGAFEPMFFAYLEDADLAWRLRSIGLNTEWSTSAVAFHAVSASVGEGSSAKSYLVARNRRLLIQLLRPYRLHERCQQLVIDALHCSYVLASTRSLAPVRGRAAALRFRRYVKFVRLARAERGVGKRGAKLMPTRSLRSSIESKRRMKALALGSDNPTADET